MDSCFTDIYLEFLGVVFHNILFYASVYPRSIFETRRKYSIVVYRSNHPEVNEYIDLCLKSAAECIKNGHLKRIEFLITDNSYNPFLKFVFDLEKNDAFDETNDAYLVQAEQNMRGFCLHLSTLCHIFQDLPEDRSFMIHFYTNESVGVAIATNPEFEGFPLIESKEKTELKKMLPIERISVRNFNIDAYIEL